MYRGEIATEDERRAALVAEIAALEARIAHQVAARATIGGADRGRRLGALRGLAKPWVIFVALLAAGGGVYVGHVFHDVDEDVGGPCGGAP